MKFLLSIFLILQLVSISAHPFKPAHYVIVDTDGGFDDMRALCMMLASSDVRILAITTSNGVLCADACYAKVKSLLYDLHHEGMLVGIARDTIAKKNDCKMAQEFNWGIPYESEEVAPDASDIVSQVLAHTTDPISFVNLGSLRTTVSCYEKLDIFKNRIAENLWSNSADISSQSFNFSTDTAAFYSAVQLKIPLILIDAANTGFQYQTELIDKIGAIQNPYSAKFLTSFTQGKSNFSMQCYDEVLVSYLHYPKLFVSDTASGYIIYSINSQKEKDELKNDFTKIIEGTFISQTQVFATFPMDTAQYYSDIQKIMTSTIHKYGNDEWNACVLANELHRHLGIYAVIGTKMGVRAKDYFGAGIDEIKIVSYAGTTPPFSCMNDGLQVSTGGTLGHGLIKVEADGQKLPEADFTYMDRKIKITLKKEYRQKIEAEIAELTQIYGLDNNAYWDLVRLAALNYWSNWDRNEIFTIKELK